MIRNVFFACCLLMANILFAQQSGDDVIGVWKNGEGTAMIKMARFGDKYQGKIVWLKEPIDPDTKAPKLDKNNPEEDKRTRPVLGMTNVWNFTYQNGGWGNGYIYDPKNGKIYDCIMTMEDKNTLNVRGYIMGMTMFGRTDTWVRQVAK
jgi:uncharacterized protein (DUF2147 family)